MEGRPQYHSYTRDDIFDQFYPNFSTWSDELQEETEVLFDEALTSLLVGDLVTISIDINGDELITPTGQTMVDINNYVDMPKAAIASAQLQKSILGCLMLHKSIFNSIILYCQFDKSNQQGLFIVNAIKNALTNTHHLPVIFVIGDNLSNLMDQTIEGFHKLLCAELGIDSDKYEGLKCLKSDEKIKQSDVEDYIGNYYLSHMENAPIKRLPPIILALNNKVQIKKVLDIHDNAIVKRIERNSNCPLRSAFVFDEFDKVYRSLRPAFKPILVDNPKGVFTVLGVTGSEDGVCDEFPEWATSNLVRVEVDSEKQKNHRGIHHSEAVIHLYKQSGSVSNSSYALNIIKTNLASFTEARVNPRDGSLYYPKSIILADSRIASHKTLATQLLTLGFHVILQNESNLKVRLVNGSSDWKPWSIRKKVVRNELYNMFNELNLWSKPVALIGNKKLDRGLGYHYAPPSGGKGLIWTDEIMGHIHGDASRVQKISRIHGVIGQCDDYPNQLHFWVDERTELTVRNENGIIKSLHENYHGFHSLGERLDYARKVTPMVKKSSNYLVSESFATQEEAKAWFLSEKVRLVMLPAYGCTKCGLYLEDATEPINKKDAVPEGTPGITKFPYRNELKQIMTEKKPRETDDIGRGSNTSARITPVFVEGIIRFVVIYIVKKTTTVAVDEDDDDVEDSESNTKNVIINS